MEALCLRLISLLLCGIEIACIQAGTNPWRKAIRWGFHGSSHPFAAPVCSIGNAGAVNVSLLSGEKADIAPSQCSEQHGTARFKEDQDYWSGDSVIIVSRVALDTTWSQSMSSYGVATLGTGVPELCWACEQYLQAMDGLLCWAAESRVHDLYSKDSELTRDGWHPWARQWLIGWI